MMFYGVWKENELNFTSFSYISYISEQTIANGPHLACHQFFCFIGTQTYPLVNIVCSCFFPTASDLRVATSNLYGPPKLFTIWPIIEKNWFVVDLLSDLLSELQSSRHLVEASWKLHCSSTSPSALYSFYPLPSTGGCFQKNSLLLAY